MKYFRTDMKYSKDGCIKRALSFHGLDYLIDDKSFRGLILNLKVNDIDFTIKKYEEGMTVNGKGFLIFGSEPMHVGVLMNDVYIDTFNHLHISNICYIIYIG